MSSSQMIDTQLIALRDRRKSLETSSSVHANAVKEHRHKRSIELQKRLNDIVIDNENAKIRNTQLIDEVIAAAIQAKVDIAAIKSSYTSSYTSSSSSSSSSIRKLKEAKQKYYQTADHLLPSWKQLQLAQKDQELRALQADKAAAATRRKVVVDILEKEEEIKTKLEQERRGLVLALALEQRDQLQAKAIAMMRQEESKRVDDAILKEITKTGTTLNDLIIGGQQTNEANVAVAHIFGITDSVSLPKPANKATLTPSHDNDIISKNTSSPNTSHLTTINTNTNTSTNYTDQFIKLIQSDIDSNRKNSSGNHSNQTTPPTMPAAVNRKTSPLTITIPDDVIDVGTITSSDSHNNSTDSNDSNEVMVGSSRDNLSISSSSPTLLKSSSRDEYRERTGSISTIVSDVVADPLSPHSPVLKDTEEIYPASSKLLQSPRNTPTTTNEDNAITNINASTSSSKSPNHADNNKTSSEPPSFMLDLVSTNDILSDISATTCVLILKTLFNKIEEIAENNKNIKIYEASSLTLDRAVANFIANAAFKNMIAELDAYGIHHYTGTVITIIQEKGSELIPEEALNGVVTVERLKKILKKNGFGRCEIWSLMCLHLQTLLKMRPLLLQELQDVFTSALVTHIHDANEKQRVERKVNKLVGLSILPEGISRSPSPPNRAQQNPPTPPASSSKSSKLQRMTFGTLNTSVVELDDDEILEDEVLEERPKLRDLAEEAPTKPKKRSSLNLESSSEFDF